MPLLHNDPEHWRKRAAEARELAAKMTDHVGKENMMAVAESYDRIAERAAQRRSEAPQVVAERSLNDLRRS
jgi:predicted Rossmann-fold nucleotide-binding protein